MLAALPEAEWQRWQAQIEHVQLSLGAVLCESGGAMSHVYFPTSGIISLLYVAANSASAEIAMVGQEGVLGVSLFSGESTTSPAVVESAGYASKLSGSDECRLFPLTSIRA